MVECIRQILQTQGVKGLYKGYTIHVLLEGVGRGYVSIRQHTSAYVSIMTAVLHKGYTPYTSSSRELAEGVCVLCVYVCVCCELCACVCVCG